MPHGVVWSPGNAVGFAWGSGMHRTRVVRHSVVLLAVCGAVAAVYAGPPIPQPLAYHDMADQRPCLGIPNCLNVLSNVPFAVVGALGLAAALGWRVGNRAHFSDPWERWPYAALFGGVALTAVGSSYYHWAPDNARLVWDRLPMTVGFMGLLTAIVAERVSVSAARWLFIPALALGVASVAYWHWSEVQGAGDLRPYALVQFGSLLVVVLLLLLYPARYAGGGYLAAAFAAYVAAKALELADEPIFALGRIVSGHTLKHLAAAGSVACLVGMLTHRRSVVGALPQGGHERQRTSP